MQLLISDQWGIYIPARFCKMYGEHWDNVPADSLAICLQGPEHPDYWEAWDEILADATLEHNGQTWRLRADGDLFAYQDGYDFDWDGLGLTIYTPAGSAYLQGDEGHELLERLEEWHDPADILSDYEHVCE